MQINVGLLCLVPDFQKLISEPKNSIRLSELDFSNQIIFPHILCYFPIKIVFTGFFLTVQVLRTILGPQGMPIKIQGKSSIFDHATKLAKI